MTLKIQIVYKLYMFVEGAITVILTYISCMCTFVHTADCVFDDLRTDPSVWDGTI